MEASSIDIIQDSRINNFLFLMPVKLGTPPVLNLVAIDAGSTLCWVQCQPCTIECHEQLVEARAIFDPRNSTSFQHVSCASSDCLGIRNGLKLGSANCMEKEDSCLYSISYGGESAYSVGKVVRDRLLVGSIDIGMLFGCSLDVKYAAKEAGIFGFGSSSFSFTEQIAAFIGYKAFTYCLPLEESEKGYMTFGESDQQGLVDGYTPLFPSSNRPTYSLMLKMLTVGGQNIVSSSSEMVVDSGALRTYLSADNFGTLVMTLEKAMDALGYSRYNPGDARHLCFQSKQDWSSWNGTHTPFTDWTSLPVVEISFAGSLKLTIPPTNLLYNDPIDGLCSTFAHDTSGKLQAQILGNRLMRSFETLFDIQGGRFGFRRGTC